MWGEVMMINMYSSDCQNPVKWRSTFHCFFCILHLFISTCSGFYAFAPVECNGVMLICLVPIPNYLMHEHVIAVALCQLVIRFSPYVILADPKPVAISPSTYYSYYLTIVLHPLPISYYNSFLLRVAITRMHKGHHQGSLK